MCIQHSTSYLSSLLGNNAWALHLKEDLLRRRPRACGSWKNSSSWRKRARTNHRLQTSEWRLRGDRGGPLGCAYLLLLVSRERRDGVQFERRRALAPPC